MKRVFTNFQVTATGTDGGFIVSVWPTNYGAQSAGLDHNEIKSEQKRFIEEAIFTAIVNAKEQD